MYVVNRDDVDGYPSIQGTFELYPTHAELVALLAPYYGNSEETEQMAFDLGNDEELYLNDCCNTHYYIQRD